MIMKKRSTSWRRLLLSINSLLTKESPKSISYKPHLHNKSPYARGTNRPLTNSKSNSRKANPRLHPYSRRSPNRITRSKVNSQSISSVQRISTSSKNKSDKSKLKLSNLTINLKTGKGNAKNFKTNLPLSTTITTTFSSCSRKIKGYSLSLSSRSSNLNTKINWLQMNTITRLRSKLNNVRLRINKSKILRPISS